MTASAFDREDLYRRRQEEVVRTAARAFSRKGFTNTSMDEVATSLGISKATLYQYFKSKQEILYECHILSIMHGEAGLALAAEFDGSGLEKFLVYLRRYMQGAFGELGGLAMLADVSSLSPDLREIVVRRRAEISHATDRLIEAGLADGSIRQCNPKIGKLFSMGVVNWIPAWFSNEGTTPAEEFVEAFVDLFISGFAARA
jgi:AcrR family transcriptional regulator